MRVYDSARVTGAFIWLAGGLVANQRYRQQASHGPGKTDTDQARQIAVRRPMPMDVGGTDREDD
jgi:hypothetical protein